MGYPPELKFEKAPASEPRITLAAKDVILNALLGHLLGNLSNRRNLIDSLGRKDALGISLPDEFCIRYADRAIDRLPIDFDDPSSVYMMMVAYDAMCDMGDAYTQQAFETTLQSLLEKLHAHVPTV